ncbi:MAG: alpha/beta hydrolase [Verrucomicrobiota bacterium]
MNPIGGLDVPPSPMAGTLRTCSSGLQRLGRIVLTLMLLGGIPLGLLAACQSKLLYFPRSYPPGASARWASQAPGQAVDFHTSQGHQRAFLQGRLHAPRNLWLVCAGNGSLALDWSDWIASHGPPEDAWLLVDFPGYGDCDGAPNPQHIRESFAAVVPLACRSIGWPAHPDSSRLRFFGHSLGSAACLLGASEFQIQRGVLLAPFTSTMDMTRVVTGMPLGWLVWHRFDNAARLAELAARGPGKVIILHGTADEVIPVAMSQALAARQPALIQLRQVPGGRHNTIQTEHAEELATALHEAGAR